MGECFRDFGGRKGGGGGFMYGIVHLLDLDSIKDFTSSRGNAGA